MHTLRFTRLLPVLLLLLRMLQLPACGSGGLMRHGVRCVQRGSTALIFAMHQNMVELMGQLLDKGADVNARGRVCGATCDAWGDT